MHTKGKLYICEHDKLRIAAIGHPYIIFNAGVFTREFKKDAMANARRLVAAWNALDGIPTEALESGVIGELIEALELAIKELDHDAPYNCWATGPCTGDPITDLILCPGCIAINKARAALSKLKEV